MLNRPFLCILKIATGMLVRLTRTHYQKFSLDMESNYKHKFWRFYGDYLLITQKRFTFLCLSHGVIHFSTSMTRVFLGLMPHMAFVVVYMCGGVQGLREFALYIH